MLVYAKRAAPKAPKKRSRAGCVNCKEKKKKCNEERPQCDRCLERGLPCGYEAVKPRRRRRRSFVTSALSPDDGSTIYYTGAWQEDFLGTNDDVEGEVQKWATSPGNQYYSPNSAALPWELDKVQGHGFWDEPLEDDIEDLVNLESTADLTVVRSRSQYPDLAMIAPCQVPSPLGEFGAPLYMEFTQKRNRRSLVDHFCNVLSHLLVFKEDTGNPFRQLVLPLSHKSPPVLNAIYALSSAHLEHRGVENEEKSLDFHSNALQGLAMLIDQKDQSTRDEVLGAIMLLVYYEVLVQRNNSNIVYGHLKGAVTIMQSMPQGSTPTSLFLERAFHFYDVIAALSLGTTPNANIESHSRLMSTAISQPNSVLSSVDTLLGLSTSLWPIIHRLSHLLPFKKSLEEAVAAGETSKAAVLRTELENTSQAIELALRDWQPTLDGAAIDNLSQETRIQSILNNAEAYRHSAFVYLYRTIHGSSRDHPTVQRHAHLSLEACSSVVSLAAQCHDGPMSALLWPLFVASCEAATPADRALAVAAFGGTERRQGMNNIMRAWDVVREVWSRADALGAGDVDWRDICHERGLSIVFG